MSAFTHSVLDAAIMSASLDTINRAGALILWNEEREGKSQNPLANRDLLRMSPSARTVLGSQTEVWLPRDIRGESPCGEKAPCGRRQRRQASDDVDVIHGGLSVESQKMVRLDETILKGLRKTTRDNPVDLARLIPWIDAAGRLIPTYDELEGALRRLILAGEIQEAGPMRFYKSEHGQVGSNFSGFSEADFNAACRTYIEAASKWIEEMDDEPKIQMLIGCCLMFAGAARDSEAAEEAADELAGQIEAALRAIADAIVGGFERSSKRSSTAITILIFGKGGNDEIDAIYEKVAPVFRAFPAQTGSRIVRYYDKAKRKIESDLVT